MRQGVRLDGGGAVEVLFLPFPRHGVLALQNEVHLVGAAALVRPEHHRVRRVRREALRREAVLVAQHLKVRAAAVQPLRQRNFVLQHEFLVGGELQGAVKRRRQPVVFGGDVQAQGLSGTEPEGPGSKKETGKHRRNTQQNIFHEKKKKGWTDLVAVDGALVCVLHQRHGLSRVLFVVTADKLSLRLRGIEVCQQIRRAVNGRRNVLSNTTQHNTTQHNTTQHNTQNTTNENG